MLSTFDVSTTGMIAQRVRMDTIAGNIASANVSVDQYGRNNPYRRREVLFAPSSDGANGVRVMGIHEDDGFQLRHKPDHPLANEQGYVKYPNVSVTKEHIDAIEAARAYEANVAAMNITKSMLFSSLRLLA